MSGIPDCDNDRVRVGIVLDVDGANADLLLIWAARCARGLADRLWVHGVLADVVCIDIDGRRHVSW